ncbi:MAG: YdgA family protein [Aggregatibacter sp.]
MKKSTLAASVIVALGAVWLGGAWYTGKVAEEEYVHQFELLNQNIQQSFSAKGLSVEFSHVAIERGLLSSKTRYDIVVKDPNKPESVFTLPFEGTLYHGPLPVNQLSQFNFTPTMFASVDKLTKNDKTTKWFAAAKGESPLSVSTSMNYQRQGKAKINFAPFETSVEKGVWQVGDVNLSVDFSQKGIQQAHLALSNIAYQEANARLRLKFNNINAMAEYQPIKEWDLLFTGQQWISGGEMYIEEEDTQDKTNHLAIKNWKIDLNTVRKEAFLDLAMNLKLDGTQLNQIHFGDLNLNTAFNHLDGETLNQVLHAKFAQIEDAPLTDAEIALIRKFFDGQPHFILRPTLSNSAGKLTTDIDVAVATSDLSSTLSTGKIFKLFRHFIFKIDANKAALIETLTAAEQLSSKLDKEEAARIAEMKISDGLKTPVQQGILVDDGKQVKLDLVLENGELKLNGKVIPEEQVASILFLAAMSMGY